MTVHYLTQLRADLPRDTGWLSPAETSVLEGLRFEKRRQDWLLGRWTAKSALARYPGLQERPIQDWEIVAAADGAPGIFLDGQPLNMPLSLSHSGLHGFCALAGRSMRLGCDIEQIEQRGRSFEETFFTTRELGLLEHLPLLDHDLVVTLIWSAKESVLKAIRQGLKADTRRIDITAIDSGDSGHWSHFDARDNLQNNMYSGWWRQDDGMAFTIASDRQVPEPATL